MSEQDDKKIVAAKPKSGMRTWRKELRRLIGPNGEKTLANLVRIADGQPMVPVIEEIDSRTGQVRRLEGPPLIPSMSEALRANIELAHMMFGKPVAQTEVAQAEAAADDHAALAALSDDQLYAEAERVLRSGLAKLDARLPAPTTDAVPAEPTDE